MRERGRPRGFLSEPLSPTARRRLEWGAILVALLGLGLMMQPLTRVVFKPGFAMLLGAGIFYVSTTFWGDEPITPKRALLLLFWVLLTLVLVIAISIALVPVLL